MCTVRTDCLKFVQQYSAEHDFPAHDTDDAPKKLIDMVMRTHVFEIF